MKWLKYIIVLTPYCVFAFNGSAQTAPVKYSEVKIGCLNFGTVNKEVIIRSASEYNDLFQHTSPHPDCAGYIPPAIDFNHYWLLGFRTKNKGCSPPEYTKEVFSIDGEITFKIKSTEKGMCKVLFEEMFWISIPIPTNPAVKFIQEKT